MNLETKLFAAARDIAGRPVLDVTLAEGATVADLRIALCEACPGLEDVLDNSLIAVDQEYARDETELNSGSEIALIPPVSGG